MTVQVPTPREGSCQSFQVPNEGYTLGNSLRFMLNKNPEVALAASSRPHPSNDFINIRIQTTGDVSAVQALGKACDDLSNLCEHLEAKFNQAVQDFEASQPQDTEMKDDS